MTVRDVCDVAYVILVEQVERRVLADRQAILSATLGRVKDVDLPTLPDAQARLDEALAEEPVRLTAVDSEQHRLRKALGVVA